MASSLLIRILAAVSCAALLLMTNLPLRQCKPLKLASASEFGKFLDPLMSLSNDPYNSYGISHAQHSQPPEAHYIIHEVSRSQDHETLESHSSVAADPNNEVRPEIFYVTADGQAVHYHAEARPPCSRDHEASANHEPARIDSKLEKDGYTGEIIYVDQNGEIVGRAETPYEQPTTQAPQVPQAELLDGTGKSSSSLEHSDLTATILTEVPMKDMPEHVLNQLKKDYGAKVIATRKHPGANLIINCDDDSNRELCSRNSPPPPSNQGSYLSTYTPTRTNFGERSQHQAELSGERELSRPNTHYDEPHPQGRQESGERAYAEVAAAGSEDSPKTEFAPRDSDDQKISNQAEGEQSAESNTSSVQEGNLNSDAKKDESKEAQNENENESKQ